RRGRRSWGWSWCRSWSRCWSWRRHDVEPYRIAGSHKLTRTREGRCQRLHSRLARRYLAGGDTVRVGGRRTRIITQREVDGLSRERNRRTRRYIRQRGSHSYRLARRTALRAIAEAEERRVGADFPSHKGRVGRERRTIGLGGRDDS